MWSHLPLAIDEWLKSNMKIEGKDLLTPWKSIHMVGIGVKKITFFFLPRRERLCTQTQHRLLILSAK